MTHTHTTRIVRFLGRHDHDLQRDALIRQLHVLRGEGWMWSQLTLALADAIDGIRTEPIHQQYADIAGPFKLWEAVHVAIADAWGQERARAAELKADEQDSADGVRRIARAAVQKYRGVM